MSASHVMRALERFRKNQPKPYAVFREFLLGQLRAERAREIEHAEAIELDARSGLFDLGERQRASAGRTTP